MTYWKNRTIWYKVKADDKKEFDIDSAYNKIVLKTKIKSYGDEATDFYNKNRLVSRFACNARVIVDASSNPLVSHLKLL